MAELPTAKEISIREEMKQEINTEINTEIQVFEDEPEEQAEVIPSSHADQKLSRYSSRNAP